MLSVRPTKEESDQFWKEAVEKNIKYVKDQFDKAKNLLLAYQIELANNAVDTAIAQLSVTPNFSGGSDLRNLALSELNELLVNIESTETELLSHITRQRADAQSWSFI